MRPTKMRTGICRRASRLVHHKTATAAKLPSAVTTNLIPPSTPRMHVVYSAIPWNTRRDSCCTT